MDARSRSSRSFTTSMICGPACPARALTSRPTSWTTGSFCYAVDCGSPGQLLRPGEAEQADDRDGEGPCRRGHWFKSSTAHPKGPKLPCLSYVLSLSTLARPCCEEYSGRCPSAFNLP